MRLLYMYIMLLKAIYNTHGTKINDYELFSFVWKWEM